MEKNTFKSTLTKKQLIYAVLDLMKKSIIIAAIVACSIMLAALVVVLFDSLLNGGASEIWDASIYMFGLGAASVLAAFIYALAALLFAVINASIVVTRDKYFLTERTFVLEKESFSITDASEIKTVYTWKSVSVCFNNARYFILKGEHNRLTIIPKGDLTQEHIDYIKACLQSSLHAKYYQDKGNSVSVQDGGDTVIKQNVSGILKEKSETTESNSDAVIISPQETAPEFATENLSEDITKDSSDSNNNNSSAPKNTETKK